MEINNDLSEEVSKEPINSFQLSYAEQAEVNRSVKLVADKESASNSQCVCNKIPVFKKASKPQGKDKSKQIEEANLSPSENVLNTQLLYDIN